jgi:hypothetical protein
VRIIWSGLAPVFMKATIQAVVGGPARKPVYKVTRKHNDTRWHWGSIVPHSVVLAMVALTLTFALRRGTLPPAIVLVPFLYWGGMYVVLLAGFVARSWHGAYSLGRTLRPTVERRVPQAPQALTPTAETTPADDRAGTREALHERLDEVLRWREAHDPPARPRVRRPGTLVRSRVGTPRRGFAWRLPRAGVEVSPDASSASTAGRTRRGPSTA